MVGRFTLGCLPLLLSIATVGYGQTPPTGTELSYRRSPQCTARVESLAITKTLNISSSTVDKFTLENDATTETARWTNWIATTMPSMNDECCGACLLDFDLVDVFYWPQPGANYDCVSSQTETFGTAFNLTQFGGMRTAANTANVPIPFRTLTRRDAEPLKGPVTAVDATGFTYTSPYNYIKVSGVVARDQCGPVGGFYTSLTWSYLPGQLSTLNGDEDDPKSFNFADLPCPPLSVMTAGANEVWYNTNDNTPYRPIIYPPPQLKMLDPAFKNCGIAHLPGLDPPQALTPHAALNVATTTYHHAASPAATTGPDYPSMFSPAPKETMLSSTNQHHSKSASVAGDSSSQGETISQAKQTLSSTALAILSSIYKSETFSTSVRTLSFAGIPSKLTESAASTHGADTEASAISSVESLDTTSMGPSSAIVAHYTDSTPGSIGGTSVLDSSKGIGSSMQPADDLKTTQGAQSELAIDGYSVTRLSEGIAVGHSTIQVGQVVTLNHATFSLASDGNHVADGTITHVLPIVPAMTSGSSHLQASLQSNRQSSHSSSAMTQETSHSSALIFTAGGQTIAPQPTGILVDGSTLLPGSGMHEGTTTISLASDASNLFVGTETISIAQATQANLGGVIWSIWQGTKTVTENSPPSTVAATTVTETASDAHIVILNWAILSFSLLAALISTG